MDIGERERERRRKLRNERTMKSEGFLWRKRKMRGLTQGNWNIMILLEFESLNKLNGEKRSKTLRYIHGLFLVFIGLSQPAAH